MKVFLIVNASASSVTPRSRVVIQRALSLRHDLTVAETARRGHATRLARGAVADGADAVVVLGGDGTLNETANGLAGSDVVLGMLPGGSTNVFARTVGFTNDPIDATGELLDAMEKDQQQHIGLGKVNDRYFLFHLGIGYDAAVIERVEKRASLKRYAGHPFFVWTSLLTWARMSGQRTPGFSVKFPRADKKATSTHGATDTVAGFFTICLNSNPYTFLGNRPFTIDPTLSLEKGLAVLTVKSLSTPTMLKIVGSAMMTGRYLRQHGNTDFRSDVSSFEISGFGPFPYQLDGDYVGDVEKLTVQHEPKKLRIYVPG
jgi:diacylglycerol kinase family enzyme